MIVFVVTNVTLHRDSTWHKSNSRYASLHPWQRTLALFHEIDPRRIDISFAVRGGADEPWKSTAYIAERSNGDVTRSNRDRKSRETWKALDTFDKRALPCVQSSIRGGV